MQHLRMRHKSVGWLSSLAELGCLRESKTCGAYEIALGGLFDDFLIANLKRIRRAAHRSADEDADARDKHAGHESLRHQEEQVAENGDQSGLCAHHVCSN